MKSDREEQIQCVMEDMQNTIRSDEYIAVLTNHRVFAEEIVSLREQNLNLKNTIRSMIPDSFVGQYFICGESGDKDPNGLPEFILVSPAYGTDFSVLYRKTEETLGPAF